MAAASRTRDHDQIRSWVEERGGIPTVVKGTEGLLRIDFVTGPENGGREESREEVEWGRWFEVFDTNGLSFLCSGEPDSKYFKLVAAERGESFSGAGPAGGERPATVVLVTMDRRGWRVAFEGGGHARTYPTKADAVQHARQVARRHQPSELLIESADGEEDLRVRYGSTEQQEG